MTAAAYKNRVLVTGSRGKSSLVRLIHAACLACGEKAYARITGVLPRELGPNGQGLILRRAGAHVEEMAWWLKRLPRDADAVILENSAIHPDLQHLAASWLKPDMVVLTNAVADHQQAWGADPGRAAEALVKGIPAGSLVVAPKGEAALQMLAEKKCRIKEAPPASGFTGADHRAQNQGLALAVCELMGLDQNACRAAMTKLPPDLADFRIEQVAAGSLAVAFSANDPVSTEALFKSLKWPREETNLLYNHRADRADRLKGFAGFMKGPWKQVLIMGQKPWWPPRGSSFVGIKDSAGLKELIGWGGRWFGCGNLAGVPLSFLLSHQAASDRPAARL